MNAHINHDLALAVIGTAAQHGLQPFGNSAFQRDFFRVNEVLRSVQGKIKAWFEVGLAGEVDRALGDVDDAVSMWRIDGARRTAWDVAAIMWRLREHPQLSADYEGALARIVNLAGRAVLI